MFYFEKIDGKNILKSDLIKNANAFFTTRDLCICEKGANNNLQIEKKQKIIAKYLNITTENLISPTQTHSANIDIAIETHHEYPETDALILAEKNL